jgi:phosphatidylglycerophosphatase A
MAGRRKRINRWLVSAGGLGFLPVAPGTWGTLAGVGIHILIAAFFPNTWRRHVAYLVAFVVVFLVGLLLAPWAEREFESKDPPPFVLDEVAGYLLVPCLFFSRTISLWQMLVLAFLTSRLFDIIKPPPARQAERLRSGWGIMCDDVIAAGYAVLTCYGVYNILLPLLRLG